MEIDRLLLSPACYCTTAMPVSLTAWLCLKMYTSVEHDFCTTFYERPPVLSDSFCWAEGVVAQDRFYCTTKGIFHEQQISLQFTNTPLEIDVMHCWSINVFLEHLMLPGSLSSTRHRVRQNPFFRSLSCDVPPRCCSPERGRRLLGTDRLSFSACAAQSLSVACSVLDCQFHCAH